MKISVRLFIFLAVFLLLCGITGAYAEETDIPGSYSTEEVWCGNEPDQIYGIAYVPDGEGKFPLVIFSHELGNNHQSGIRYAERLAENGYAAYVFDFRGGSASGVQNRSGGSNSEMSVMTEASDLETVLATAKTWSFVDSSHIFLLGGSQGGLVTIVTAAGHQDEIAGMMLMYPALSAKEDHRVNSYQDPEDVPDDVSLFGGWMHVGRNYITDIWDVDFYELLASYQGKVLLLHGDRDLTVPLSYSEKALELIPECEFHVIKDGGHEFFGQPFEDAVTYILSYLQKQLDGEKSLEEKMQEFGMKIGNTPVQVEWESNESVEALKRLTASAPLTIQMSMYGGFEQVGAIGTGLPRNDVQTVTNAGDIVLYSGNQIVVFYGSNSWAYTRLGRITDKTQAEMTDLLGRGNTTITIGTGL
ncbi:MAG: alpha/beta hydrolase [Anaerolineaceae bacterium]|nr:alpha/beta hydrolase [Anaerolineaceae bacterium]